MTHYTGQETWLKRAASVFGGIFGRGKTPPERAAEILEAVAPDATTYPKAFRWYLEQVILPQERGAMSEYERLKANAVLFERLLAEERALWVEERTAKAEADALEDRQRMQDRIEKGV